MRLPFALFLMALSTTAAIACDSRLRAYPFECSLQDEYQAVTGRLSSDFGVDAEYTVGYRALRVIEQADYDRSSQQTEFMPWKIYEPAPSTWMLWEQGAWMVDQMAADESLKALTIEDVEALNKVLISKEMMTDLARFKGNVPGKIRTSRVFLPPGAEFKCGADSMSEASYQLIKNYDLKDYEGKPLLRPHFFGKCKEGGYKGQIWYLKSGKVRKELQRWADNFNSHFRRYLAGERMTMSPLEFIADSQRWFIAIHPFGDGNGRTSRFIQDLFLKKLGLPFMPTGRISMLSTRDAYVARTKSEIKKSIKLLNNCLSGYQKRQASRKTAIYGHCLPLYQDADTGEKDDRKKQRFTFAQQMRKILGQSE